MSALLKSLAEVSKNAFKRPDLKLVHSSKIVPIPDMRTEKARAEKVKKVACIALGGVVGFALIGYFFSTQISLFMANKNPAVQPRSLNPQDQIRELSSDSVLAYNTRDFVKARNGFQKLSQMNPNDPVSLNNWALSLKASGSLKEARALYQRGLAKFPKDSVLLNNYGVFEFEHGSIELAELKLKSSLEIRPNYKEALLNLAHLYELKGEWTSALTLYEKYLEGKNGEISLNEKLRERIRKIHSLSQAGRNKGERI